MKGGNSIVPNYIPYPPYHYPTFKNPVGSSKGLQITQLAERFGDIKEFVPMSSLKLNVDATEFTPTIDQTPITSQKPSPSDSHQKSSVLSSVTSVQPSAPCEEESKLTKPDHYKYTSDQILLAFNEFLQIEDFRRLDPKLASFAHRKNQVFRVFRRGNSQKTKKTKHEPIRNEEFKPAELENWRKAKSLEEEKIRKQAVGTTLKLTSTKDDREQITRKIKITLNKLSPSNLPKLQPELLSLAKTSREALAFLIQTIFEKSWAEVKYTAMYAQLCQILKQEFTGFLYDGESPSKKNQNWFRYCLLNHVQHAFEDTQDSPSKDAETKALLHKKKTHGSVRFIAELLKVGIISAKIIQDIVESLINLNNKDPLFVDEEKVEVACVLISTAAGFNEKANLRAETDKIFAYLAEILDANPAMSSKVKFSIMNLVDERKAGWVKDVSEQPKTVEEIREEFDRKKN
jgi:DNA-directed RNA polymerase subunit F